MVTLMMLEDVEVKAARYIKLRDFKETIMKERMARIDAEMEKLEGEMMTFLNETGQESAKTKSGTFSKRMSTSVRMADRDVFIPWVIANNLTMFLTSHINKAAVTEYLEEHKELPPGVDVTRIVSISVLRPKTR